MILSLNRDLAERRSFLDPHNGRSRTNQRIRAGLARAAIVDVARDRLDRFFVLDAWADRVKTNDITDKIVEHWSKWHPSLFGIDSTAQQNLYVEQTRTVLRLQGHRRINIMGIPAPTREGDKIYRIRTTLQPIIADHRLLVADGLVELRAEMAAFPTGATVDLLDALCGAILMFPIAVTAEEQQMAGDDAYAEFLADCGLDEDAIAERLGGDIDNDSQFQYNRGNTLN